MIERFNNYSHGFISIPTILACQKKGLFALIKQAENISADDIAKRLNANRGFLDVALKLLKSLKFVEQNSQQEYCLTEKAELIHLIPDEIDEIFHLNFLDCLKYGKNADPILQ